MYIDEKLILKYNRPVPRYTSYPPANHFKTSITPVQFTKKLEESNRGTLQNISLYLHIPFCRKRCFYCGCNAYSMSNSASVDQYIDSLISELHMIRPYLDPSRGVSQIHFGGGTPNTLSIPQVRKIMHTIRDQFHFTEQPEIAMECHPAWLDIGYLNNLIDLGFNRFSLGIQDFNTDVLQTINRDPSALPVEKLIGHIRKKAPEAKVNFDLLYGLPKQSVASFSQTIEQALTLRPDRLVTFSYAHLPSVFKAQKLLEEAGLPSSGEKMQLFLTAFEKLTQNGYQPIGFDHFALEDDELSLARNDKTLHRNFQGYTTRKTTGQVYALGVSGITQLENMYAQTTKDPDIYSKSMMNKTFAIEKGYLLNRNEQVIRRVIDDLMCNMEVDFQEIAGYFGTDAEDIRLCLHLDRQELDSLQEDGIIIYNTEKIQIAEKGLLFTRNVAAALDPLMETSTRTYSKTV